LIALKEYATQPKRIWPVSLLGRTQHEANTVFVNGRFVTLPPVGVRRFATEVARRLVESPTDTRLVLPRDASVPEWANDAIVIRGRTSGQVFEQIELPLISRRGVLLSMGGPISLLAGRQVGVLYDAGVFKFREIFSRRFGAWYRFMYKYGSRALGAVVTDSHHAANELSSFAGIPVERLTVVGCGADHVMDWGLDRLEMDLPDSYFVILGTTSVIKNVAPVVDAFCDAGIPIVVVGGKSPTRVDRETDSLEIHGKAIRTGRVSDANIRWLLENAEALVFPSFHEGFGLPIVEAQQLGCPVIASNASCIPEVAGDAALYFNPTRPTEAVDLAKTLIGNPALRSELIESGRVNAERFRWGNVSGSVERLLSGVE